ncbi:MAG TPA: site-specific integrase [Streptosporangiaceae bacterium]
MFAAYQLIALRGLRRGEACGLRWADLDLDAGLAYITRQVQHVAGKLTACPLKTPASRRAVALDPATIAALREHRRAQQLNAQARGITLSGYVFTPPGGGPLCPEHLTRTFNTLVAGAGLPPVRLHDLRHGAATLYQVRRRTAHPRRGAGDLAACSPGHDRALPHCPGGGHARQAPGALRPASSPAHLRRRV